MKLSPTQQNVIDTLTDVAQPLVRREGGFWTYRGCALTGAGIPKWWVTVQTVRALEKAGRLKRLHEFPEEWRDSRGLA